MKACFSVLCFTGLLFSMGCAAPTLEGQYVPPPPGPPDQLELLVGPIALYPDPLVALILPASTASTDIVLAARYFEGGDVNAVETQPWEDSVRSLAHYPELVRWLNENLAWTRQLGDAYYDQPEAVMAAIQRARARALANGTLVTTSQQQVVIQDGHILILPAQPDLIYVPRYDPDIIYLERAPGYYSGTWMTFGMGFGVGWWLGYHCDWGHHVIWFDQDRREHWRERRDWSHHDRIPQAGSPPPNGWRHWKPGTDRDHRHPDRGPADTPRRITPRPRPFEGTPPLHPRHPRADSPRAESPRIESPREHREPAPRTPSHPVTPEPEHRTPSPVVQQPAPAAPVVTGPVTPPASNRALPAPRTEPRPERRNEPRDFGRRGPEGNRQVNVSPTPAPNRVAPSPSAAPRPAPRMERPNPPNRQVGSPTPAPRPAPPPRIEPARSPVKPPPPRPESRENDKDKDKDR